MSLYLKIINNIQNEHVMINYYIHEFIHELNYFYLALNKNKVLVSFNCFNHGLKKNMLNHVQDHLLIKMCKLEGR